MRICSQGRKFFHFRMAPLLRETQNFWQDCNNYNCKKKQKVFSISIPCIPWNRMYMVHVFYYCNKSHVFKSYIINKYGSNTYPPIISFLCVPAPLTVWFYLSAPSERDTPHLLYNNVAEIQSRMQVCLTTVLYPYKNWIPIGLTTVQ